jgi:hypothetical protein
MSAGRIFLELTVVVVGVARVQRPSAGGSHRDRAVPWRVPGKRDQQDVVRQPLERGDALEPVVRSYVPARRATAAVLNWYGR